MNLPRIAEFISLLGGAFFSYMYICQIGNLRDRGRAWKDALYKENDVWWMGSIGIVTLGYLFVATVLMA